MVKQPSMYVSRYGKWHSLPVAIVRNNYKMCEIIEYSSMKKAHAYSIKISCTRKMKMTILYNYVYKTASNLAVYGLLLVQPHGYL